MNCLSALSPPFFSPFAGFSSGSSSDPWPAPAALDRARLARPGLGDAVGDEADRVEAGHVLLLEEEHRVALALAEQRDEDVGPGDLLAARRLDMEDRALDDALEPGGRRRIDAGVGLQRAEFGVEIFGDVGAELLDVDRARLHHRDGMGVAGEREQQVLERRIFVVAPAGLGQRVVQRMFEIAGETRAWTSPGAARQGPAPPSPPMSPCVAADARGVVRGRCRG